MPAIQPAKLKQESARLAGYYRQPDKFTRELHRLLDLYADRTQRPGHAGEPVSILPTYNVPPPLMRQLTRDLNPIAHNQKEDTLSLCDNLWGQDYFEMRYLAVELLGQIDINPPEPVITRLIVWSDETVDERMLQVLLDSGLVRMRAEAQKQIFILAEEWLNSSTITRKQLGVRVLFPLSEDTSAQNLPIIFRLTTPFIRQVDSDLRPDVLMLWKQLTQRTPQETAYHLRQNLNAPDNPDIEWFIRHLIPHFPPDLQQSLRAALKASYKISSN